MAVIHKIFASLIIVIGLIYQPTLHAAANNQLLLQRITSTDATAAQVEIFNQSGVEQVLSNWQLQYVAASEACDTVWDNQDATVVELTGTATASSTASIDLPFGVAESGVMRLVETSTAAAHDLVGWGTSQCYETEPTASLAEQRSLVRRSCQQQPVDTDNNYADFYEASNNDAAQENCSTEASCHTVIISEVSPTTNGNQSEFVELFNPSAQSIDISGCQLISSASSSNHFLFNDQPELSAGSYRIVEGLTLLDSGGEVSLSSSSTEEIIQTVSYPDMSGGNKGSSLAWDGQKFVMTTSPTPGSTNQITAPSQDENDDQTDSPDDLPDCGPGKMRNPETNRCRTITASGSELTACRADQERNPETNRCKSTVTSSNDLVPCQPGQERNPATNRCRKNEDSESDLKACSEGQERNPETNRCRKVSSSVSGSPSGSESSGAGNTNANTITNSPWTKLAVGLGVISALTYGGYEYRNDIKTWWRKLRGKSSSTITS